jgi:hypothetical protein
LTDKDNKIIIDKDTAKKVFLDFSDVIEEYKKNGGS